MPRGKEQTRKKMIEYKNVNKFSFSLVFVSFLRIEEVSHGTTQCSTLLSLNALIMSSILFVMFEIKNISSILGFWRNWIGICYILSSSWHRWSSRPSQFPFILNYFVIFFCRLFQSNAFCDLNIYFLRQFPATIMTKTRTTAMTPRYTLVFLLKTLPEWIFK